MKLAGLAIALSLAARCAAAESFAFAVISDLHVGDAQDDFGTPGYDDALSAPLGGQESVRNSQKTVEKVNALTGRYSIKFVVVTGDLTDSAERSEFAAARRLLDGLSVPYVPLPGNHDLWPYTSLTEASAPIGDQYFEEAFGDVFEALRATFPGLRKAVGPVWNPERGAAARPQNLAFSFGGYGFVCLDWNSRRHAARQLPGSHPQADLHDFAGGTYPWLTELIRSGWLDDKKRVFLFQHHPFRTLVPDWGFGFSRSEKKKVAALLRPEEFWGVFAGHQHRNFVGEAFDDFDRIPRPFQPGPLGPAWKDLLALARSPGGEALRDAPGSKPQLEPFHQVETAAAKSRVAITLVQVEDNGQITVTQHE